MKTIAELLALRKEYETLNTKLAELTPEELAQVAGGHSGPESGLRSNRTPEEAAGVPISERMRGQLPGELAAATNSQDSTVVKPIPDALQLTPEELLKKLMQ